jgi:hypothetical protein
MSSTFRLEDLRINQEPIPANMIDIQPRNDTSINEEPVQHNIINIRTNPPITQVVTRSSYTCLLIIIIILLIILVVRSY